MKKLFFIIPATIAGVAWPSAGFSDYPLCKIISYTGGNFLTGVNYTYDLSCYNTGEELNACTQCSAYNTTTTNGVVVTTTKEIQGTINNNTYTIMCMCKTTKTTATCAA